MKIKTIRYFLKLHRKHAVESKLEGNRLLESPNLARSDHNDHDLSPSQFRTFRSPNEVIQQRQMDKPF